MASSSTVVQTNVMALNSHRNLSIVGGTKQKASERLSSGYKINSAADDAAGLAISEKMRAQIRGLDMASKNTQDATSLLQTAEGGLQQINDMLQRIRELVVQAGNDTNEGTDSSSEGTDRAKIAAEIEALTAEIKDMGARVQFNKIDVLSSASTLTFQVGANGGQTITFDLAEINVLSKVVDTISNELTSGSVASQISSLATGYIGSQPETISTLIGEIDKAMKYVTVARAKLGAVQNRLEYTNKSLEVSSENLSNAESRIRDADMAKEMMSYTQANVLQQAAISMLAQANQQPQSILQLLQ